MRSGTLPRRRFRATLCAGASPDLNRSSSGRGKGRTPCLSRPAWHSHRRRYGSTWNSQVTTRSHQSSYRPCSRRTSSSTRRRRPALTAATTFAAAVASSHPKCLCYKQGGWSFRLSKTNRRRRRRRGHHGQAYEPHSRRHEVRRGYRATRRETAKMSSPTRYEPWTASVGLLQCFILQ